ncbi:YihY/virulence factor BrkB family protein [Thiohalomonas denitrificans]|uniref:YihY/virulence factor BrkB family protein n=1 Tax=Thiohalomonas denitrificans TaxID=415747 RepID=UPI0026EDEBC4|nr:YihY/virulence factor BrkB family protein [Thiohalomonas denitrificans]
MADHQQAMNASRPRELSAGDWRAVGKRVKGDVSQDNLSVISAGVAFYAFLALFPALIALVSLYGLVASPTDVERLVGAMEGIMPQEVASIVSSQLQQVVDSAGSQLGIGLLIGVLVALWSATKGTKSLMTALNIVYEEQEERGFFRLNGVALLLTLGAIVAVILATGMVVAVPAILSFVNLPGVIESLVNWLRWPILALLAAFGIGILYRFAPSRHPPRWRWLNYGALTATVLWLIASGLFSWYVSNFGSYNETYGSMAAIVVLLMWFYLSAFVVLLGAELNREMEMQTEVDTTTGEPLPRGRRGATAADHVAGEDRDRFKA